MAAIKTSNKTATSFTCTITGLDTSYTGTTRVVTWYVNGSQLASKTIANGSSSGGAINVSGASPSTTYTIKAIIVYSGGSTTLTANVTTLADLQRPDDWYWLSTVSSGSTINLSASGWNKFCSRINDFREYKEMSDYSFTSVSSGDSIKATTMNKARLAILGITGHGTVPSSVSSGDEISASFFNQLKNALNAIP